MRSVGTSPTQLPPLVGIQDPAAARWMQALASAWDQRAGTSDPQGPERFITAREFGGLALSAITQAFGAAPSGPLGGNGDPASAAQINGVIDHLSNLVVNSVLYRQLGERIESIDLQPLRNRIEQVLTEVNATIDGLDEGITERVEVLEDTTGSHTTQINAAVSRLDDAEAAILEVNETHATDLEATTTQIEAAVSRIDGAEAAILSEATTRATEIEAVTEQLDIAVSRIDDAEAANTAEASTRATRDYALAEAINTMWASIGGASAVIQDGVLAAATPNSAAATKWLQVVASVTDPNTGLVNSTSIKQDLNSYASNINGRLSSTYTVRAQVSVGGQTVVGGFGLAASSGSGGITGPAGEGATIDFGVRADKFFIAATSSTPDAITQMGQTSSIPFIVVTTPTVMTVNGQSVTYPAGVYMKTAVIGSAAIGTAQIADLAVTTAKIGNATITNAKIADNIQSDNYVSGSAGWRIHKTGFTTTSGTFTQAEFNGIVLSRANVVASGTAGLSGVAWSYVSTSGEKGTFYHWEPGTGESITFFIDTGYDDYSEIDNLNRPAFIAVAKINSTYATWPGGGPGSALFGRMRCSASVVRQLDHYATGASGVVPGGRLLIALECFFPGDIHPTFNSITYTAAQWAMLRVS